MSSKNHTPFVLEWSSKALVGYDAVTHTTRSYSSVSEVAAVTKEAIIAISRRSVFIRPVRVPDVSHEEIRQVLSLRLADLFPVATHDLAIDFELTDDISPEGRLAMVAAMPVAELTRVYTECRAAGLKVARVVPSALSSALIEATATGGSAVVQDTIEGLAIDVISDGVLRQSRITNLPQQLQSEVCRTFGLAGLECGTIVSAGGLALPFADVVVKEPGLAILQKYQERLHLNLELPEEVASRRRKSKAQNQRLSMLFLAASAVIGLYVFMDYQDAASSVNQKTAAFEKRVKSLKADQQKLDTSLKVWTAYQANLDRAYTPAQKFVDIMTILSNRAPQGVWLNGMTLERGKVFSARGSATSNEALALYLGALSSEPRFRNVKLVFSNNSTIDQTPVVQFSITGFPVGNLPLFDDTKVKR